MARKLRSDESIDSEKTIRRGKKSKGVIEQYDEAAEEVNDKINNC